MSDEQLSSMGVCTIGERLRLRAFCSPGASTSKSLGLSKTSDRQEKVEKVQEILNRNKRGKRSSDSVSSTGCPSKVRQKVTLKFDFGWKHYVDGKYKLKRSDRGGGKRRIDVSKTASYDECLQIAKKLFFPKGLSDEGHEDDMYFLLADNNSSDIENLEDGSEIIPFSPEKYKEVTGFTLPGVYLLSRTKSSVDDDSSDEGLTQPVFEGDQQDQASALIGSSASRSAFFAELERQVSESATIDGAKEASRVERIQEEITKAEKDAEALEMLRKARELRVPPEPDSAHSRVVLSVRHLHLGVLTRAFFTTNTISAVYDWVGSLSKTPKHFILSKVPTVPIYPDESVTVADKEVLTMTEEESAIPLSRDETEITFYSGESDSETNKTLPFSEATIMEVGDKPPEVLLEDDDGVEGTTEDEDTLQGFKTLEERRKAHAQKSELLKEELITVSRHNVLKELLAIYQDPQISQKKLVAFLDEDSGSGDGVLREIYSIFWSNFVTQNCEGSSQFAISVTPAMQPQDYVFVGRILTHSYIQCGRFPVQLARASLHQAIFDSVSDEILLDSFLMLLPVKERDSVLSGLNGTGRFPLEEILDILDDFKESTMPTPENFRSLLIKVAKSELVTKPYLPLLKLREGMGEFWNGLRREELDAIYHMCNPTPQRVARYLKAVANDAQEQRVVRWLKRYTRNLDDKMAVRFVRFCTASDVLIPGRNILVRFQTMTENAISPKARTCFLTLTVARNYRSYNQLRDNFDFFLRDPSLWDLSD